MAIADQLKALLKSHSDGDEQLFFSVAMQLAAHEAKLGHGKLAEEIRDLIDSGKRQNVTNKPTVSNRFRGGDLNNLLSSSMPRVKLSDMVLDETLDRLIHRVIKEQRHAPQILEHGLSPRRKLLLVGPPGTGKTLTASMLSGELGIPLFQVRLDSLITKFMGETAARMRQIFEATGQSRGVYFFDEFDAIGSQRGMTNDIGEIRRILNSFLQMIEQDKSNSLIIAATNHAEILDHALFRRFDDVLRYELPTEIEISTLLKNRLARHATKSISWRRLAESAVGLSHAEVTRAAEEVLKETLIFGRERITEADIRKTLLERLEIAGRFNKNP